MPSDLREAILRLKRYVNARPESCDLAAHCHALLVCDLDGFPQTAQGLLEG